MKAETGYSGGYRVGDLTIDNGRRLVLRGAEPLQVSGLSYDLFIALAEAAPNLLTQDELMERVWPGVVVSPETVSQRVKLLRSALNDDPRAPRYITVVRGRGYRVVADVLPLDTGAAESPPPIVESGESSESAPPEVSARPAALRRWLWPALLAGILIAIAVGWAYSDRAGRARMDRSVAVLPLANLSNDPANEYFSDGLTDELRVRLTAISGLHVSARTSSSYFRGRNETARTIGRMLGVRHLLGGSVRRTGDHIRVTAQLTDSETGYELWSRTFDRRLEDAFVIQDEIALAVVENLHVTLLAGEAQGATPPLTRSAEALDLYFRARHLHQSFQPDRMDRAIVYYGQAIELDPRFAAAYVGLADTLLIRRQVAELGPTDPARTRIVPLLRTALEIDPNLGDAHAILAKELEFSFDLEGAAREFALAERASPNSEYVLRYIAQFYACCSWPAERGIEYARRGRELDRLNPWAGTNVGIAYWNAHRLREALREVDLVIEVEPQFWIAHWLRTVILDDLGRFEEALASARRAVELNDYGDTRTDLAVAYARLGRLDEARAIYDELARNTGGKYWPPTEAAAVLVALNDRPGALAALERAYEERDWMLFEAMHGLRFEPLHGDTRFERLVKLLGQEQRAAAVTGRKRSAAN